MCTHGRRNLCCGAGAGNEIKIEMKNVNFVGCTADCSFSRVDLALCGGSRCPVTCVHKQK